LKGLKKEKGAAAKEGGGGGGHSCCVTSSEVHVLKKGVRCFKSRPKEKEKWNIYGTVKGKSKRKKERDGGSIVEKKSRRRTAAHHVSEIKVGGGWVDHSPVLALGKAKTEEVIQKNIHLPTDRHDHLQGAGYKNKRKAFNYKSLYIERRK